MKRIILSLSCVLLFQCAYSQNQGVLKCGSDHYYQEHLNNHPQVVADRDALEQFTVDFAQTQNSESKTAAITIPVVFHINDPSNPQ